MSATPVSVLYRAALLLPSSAAVGGGGIPLTFEQLLMVGGLPKTRIEVAVVLRARIQYGHMIIQAVMERNPMVAREAYELAKLLPSTTTAQRLRLEGYKINGLLCEGSELVICYKGERVHLLKGLRDEEAVRARIFHEAVAGEPIPHVTPYELVDTASGKHFMIMPKFATALEPLPYLSPAGVSILWEHLRQALDSLHARGFAHADVKPANICLSEDGSSAVLIDLGSVARLAERTSSTPAYVPCDFMPRTASVALDWWMLAMTLAEKGCGPDHPMKIGGERSASKAELQAHLAAYLDPAVWAALEPKLAG